MAERKLNQNKGTNYLLSGLLYCGVCGAKMRYQKWDKKTGECKIVCYSRQKSRAYLVKGENCDNELYWASNIEDAVVSTLFSMSYLVNDDEQKTKPDFDPTESLRAELKKEKRYLGRLYNSVDEEAYDVLKDKITKSRLRIKQLTASLIDAEKQLDIERKISKTKHVFKNLQSTWDYMSPLERQSVCRELIDRVEVGKDGNIDIHLKHSSFLVGNKNNN